MKATLRFQRAGIQRNFLGLKAEKVKKFCRRPRVARQGPGSYTTNTALSGAAAYGYKASQPSARIGRKQPRRVRSPGIPFVTSA